MFLVVVPAKKAGYRGMTFAERAAARLARGPGGFDYVSRCVGHCSLMDRRSWVTEFFGFLQRSTPHPVRCIGEMVR